MVGLGNQSRAALREAWNDPPKRDPRPADADAVPVVQPYIAEVIHWQSSLSNRSVHQVSGKPRPENHFLNSLQM